MFCGILDAPSAPPHFSIQVATPRAVTRPSSGRRWSPSRARPPWCGTGNHHHTTIMSCQVYWEKRVGTCIMSFGTFRPHYQYGDFIHMDLIFLVNFIITSYHIIQYLSRLTSVLKFWPCKLFTVPKHETYFTFYDWILDWSPGNKILSKKQKATSPDCDVWRLGAGFLEKCRGKLNLLSSSHNLQM